MDCVQHASGVLRRIALLVVAAVAGAGLFAAMPARAATTNRAAVVVFVNGGVHTAKITFSTDSISGLDALRDAGFAPSLRAFGGNGGAVCALDVGGTTIGCPADNTCLNCAHDSSYWQYWRALAGATQYTYSLAGGGNTQVHDGDVEAWQWASSAAPPTPFVSFAQVWDPAPTTTTRPPVTTSTTRATTPRSVTTVGGLGTATTITPATPTTRPPAKAPRATPTTLAPTTTRASGTPTTRSTESGDASVGTGSVRKLASAPVVARGGGGSPYGLIGFAAMLVALIVAIVLARRRRSLTSRLSN